MQHNHIRLNWVISLIWAMRFYKALSDSYRQYGYLARRSFYYYLDLWVVFEYAIGIQNIPYPESLYVMPNTKHWIRIGRPSTQALLKLAKKKMGANNETI